MKTKPVILLAAISTLLAGGAFAQEATPPAAPPPPPPSGARGDAPHPPRDGDAQRPPGGPREGGGEARRGGPRDGDAPRGPGGPRDGDRGPGGPRDGDKGPGGPREGAGRGPGGLGGPRDGAGKGPEGFRDGGPRGSFGEQAREVRKETRAYLGVLATPVPPPLAAQLGLTEGFGLVVMEVAPESPAAKAGVQKFDVLKLLNDQQIIDQNQLSTLVSGQGKGKEVSLTVIRKAQEQKIAATLGEHTVTVRENHEQPGHPGLPGFPGLNPEMRQRLEEHMHNAPDRMREMQEKMHEFQERMKGRRGGKPGDDKPGDGKPDEGRRGVGRPGAEIQPERLLQEAQVATSAQIQVQSDSGTTTINSAHAHLHLKDSTGEIDIASQDGKRVLTATDADGKVVFTGPVSTEEERAAIPEPIRKKLAEIHVREDIRAGGSLAEVSVTVSPTAPGTPDEADFQ